MMEIQELDSQSFEKFNELYVLIQNKKKLHCHRLGDPADLYKLLSCNFHTYTFIVNQNLGAATSILSLFPESNLFFITDLFKNPESKLFLGTKLIAHFLEVNDLWKQQFCLTFVEEDLYALDALVNMAIKKYGLVKREELIFSNIFNVGQVVSGRVDDLPLKKSIGNVECTFFTDKNSRYFTIGEKKYSRAYVSLSENVSEDQYIKIIEGGKAYARKAGCNVFVLLTHDKKDLQQDFLHVNRKIELWNKEIGSRVDLCLRGILI